MAERRDFEVVLYNKEVREVVERGERHKNLDDSWADLRHEVFQAKDEDEARRRAYMRYPEKRGFVIVEVVPEFLGKRQEGRTIMTGSGPADTVTITGYHAHIYYDEASRATAAHIREELDARFEVRLGRWREEPVGPHPRPMYQVAFAADQFPEIVPWLMLNHAELVVFIHPETGDDLADHADHPLWLGEKLALKLDIFNKS